MGDVGFTIMSHRNPAQLQRLTLRLDTLYEPTAIACHHDFGRIDLELSAFPKSVVFVEPHWQTQWGTISLVMAGLSALDLLYRVSDPEWFIMLSESDYPVRAPERVLDELRQAEWDAFLDHREIRQDPTIGLKWRRETIRSHAQPEWRELAFSRYLAVRRYPLAPHACTRTQLRCFAGDQWLTGNRRAAQSLLAATSSDSPILNHFCWCPVPDEAVYHTILCNDASLSICSDNRRYSDWSAGGKHPKELGVDDISSIVRSDADFARKFRANSEVLDEFDRLLGS